MNSNSTPEQPETQIRAIQPGSVIPFPVWIWDAGMFKEWIRVHSEHAWKCYAGAPFASHWAPDGPKPTVAPALHVIREEQKQKSDTPKTDTECASKAGYGGHWVSADFARGLERELNTALKQIDNQASIIRHSVRPASERELMMLDEIKALRGCAQYYAGECVNYDGGAYARIVLEGQSVTQRPTP